MKLLSNRLGFTLIELLVAITIIGILTAGGVSVYTSNMQRARDSNRLTDVSALQSAVEQYNQDRGMYPKDYGDWLNVGGTSSTSVSFYLPTLAGDPNPGSDCIITRCAYVYSVQDSDSGITRGAYEISTGFQYQQNVNNSATTDSGDDTNRLEKGFEVSLVDTKMPVGTNPTLATGGEFALRTKIVVGKNDNGSPSISTFK